MVGDKRRPFSLCMEEIRRFRIEELPPILWWHFVRSHPCMPVFAIFTASDMKPHMGPKSDLCPRTSDSSEGHHAFYLIMCWEVKSRLTDGEYQSVSWAWISAVSNPLRYTCAWCQEGVAQREWCHASARHLASSTWEYSTWASSTWMSSTWVSSTWASSTWPSSTWASSTHASARHLGI